MIPSVCASWVYWSITFLSVAESEYNHLFGGVDPGTRLIVQYDEEAGS